MDKARLEPLRSGARLEPLRSWADFFPGSERFAKPEFRDTKRWNTRVVSNLVYYQTNYLVLTIAVFIVVGLVYPKDMLSAMIGLSGAVLLRVYAEDAQDAIRTFKREYPVLFVIGVVMASCLTILLLGNMMIFMTAIFLSLTLIVVHATFRLRNIKNKLQNKIEGTVLRRSPMGLLLMALGETKTL